MYIELYRHPDPKPVLIPAPLLENKDVFLALDFARILVLANPPIRALLYIHTISGEAVFQIKDGGQVTPWSGVSSFVFKEWKVSPFRDEAVSLVLGRDDAGLPWLYMMVCNDDGLTDFPVQSNGSMKWDHPERYSRAVKDLAMRKAADLAAYRKQLWEWVK